MIFVDVAMRAPSEAAIREFLPKIRAAVAGTHKENGCIIYRFTIDMDDPCILHVTELWESEEALFGHFKGEAVKIMFEIVPNLQVLGAQAYRGDLEPFDLPLPAELSA